MLLRFQIIEESQTLFYWQNISMFDKNDILLQHHKICAMTTSEKILNYATMQGGTFQRRDLLCYIVKKYPGISEGTVDLQVNRLVLEKPRDFDPFGQTGFAHLWLQYD